MKKTQTIEKKIRDIVGNMEWLQPEMIITTKEPFFWRFDKKWVNSVSKELEALLQSEIEAERAYIGKNKREAYQMGVAEERARLKKEVENYSKAYEHSAYCAIKGFQFKECGKCALDNILLLLDKEGK